MFFILNKKFRFSVFTIVFLESRLCMSFKFFCQFFVCRESHLQHNNNRFDFYLWSLDFDEDFIISPKENEVNNDRENQN